MAVMNAQYKHPSDSAYSHGLRDLIDDMLKADPKQRPDIHQVRWTILPVIIDNLTTAAGHRKDGSRTADSSIALSLELSWPHYFVYPMLSLFINGLC